jgi:hypothetical protein
VAARSPGQIDVDDTMLDAIGLKRSKKLCFEVDPE